MTNLNVIVNGVLGKMGQEVLSAVQSDESLTPVGGTDIFASSSEITIPNSSLKIPVSTDLTELISTTDVVVDFTNADGARKVIKTSALNGVNCVIGSTGLSDEDFAEAERLANENILRILG